MNKTLLFARTRYDNHNEYLYAYSEEIISEAKERNWSVHRIEDEEVNRDAFVSRLSKIQYQFVVFNGHGDEDKLLGYGDKILLTAQKDARLFSGKIGFLRACDSVNWFCKEAAEKGGAKCMIGYIGAFSFWTLDKFALTPLRDPLAQPVFKVSNLVPLKLIRGATVEDAVGAAKREARTKVRELLAGKRDEYTQLIVDTLIDNEISLDTYGDTKASVG